MTSSDARPALRAAAAVGPYFAVDEPDDQRVWIPLTRLLDDSELLRERVDVARTVLASRTGAEVDLRACASINFLGTVSRLVAPALGAAAVAEVVPLFGPDAVLWSPVEGGPIPIAVADPRGRSVENADEAAETIHAAVIATAVVPLVDAYALTFHVSTQVLWGNVASALAGAAGLLDRADVPQLIAAIDIVEAALRLGPLVDTGHYERPDPRRPRAFFVRHNCCLFYKIPAGGKCADCVLVAPVARADMWRQELDGAS